MKDSKSVQMLGMYGIQKPAHDGHAAKTETSWSREITGSLVSPSLYPTYGLLFLRRCWGRVETEHARLRNGDTEQ